MPRPDAARHLAERVNKLRHPSGTAMRLMEFYAGPGLTPQVKAQQQQRSLMVTEAAIHELERAGYQISHKDDPKPADAEDYKRARVKCLRCGKEIFALGVDPNMAATLSPLAARSLAAALTDHPQNCSPGATQ